MDRLGITARRAETAFLPSYPAVRAAVLRPILAFSADRGLNPARFLRGHGIDPAAVADPYACVPLATYVRMFEELADRLDDPLLGARIGHEIAPADLGPRGVLFSLSGDLGTALGRLSGWDTSFQSHTASGLESGPRRAIWYYAIRDQIIRERRQDSEYSLACICQMIRRYFDARWRPLEIRFEHADLGYRRELETLFRARVVFGAQGNAIVLHNEILTRKVRSEDAGLINILETHIRGISKNTVQDDLLSSVTTIIENHIRHEKITVDFVASILGLSRRTLQRRLHDEGVSLRNCVEDYRRTTAAEYLQEARHRLSDIAAMLGYTDGTAFWRARQRWESGKGTPTA